MGLPDKLDIRKEADRNWLALHNIELFLDGERVDRCIAFDVKAGSVVRQKMGDDGRVKLTASGKAVATETVHGKVEVRWK